MRKSAAKGPPAQIVFASDWSNADPEKLLWAPNAGMQMDAYWREEFEVYLGGPKNTGKSWFAIGWLIKGNARVPGDKASQVDLSYVAHPQYRAVVLRRNNDDLLDWVEKAKPIYEKFGCDYTKQPHEFTFRSGAKIVLGHLADSESYMRWTGQQVIRYFIDEVTHIPDFNLYMKIYSSCRSSFAEMKPQLLLASNPEGPGLGWVTDRFVRVQKKNGEYFKPGETMYERHKDPVSGETRWTTRVFLRGRITENVQALAADPNYYARLAAIPDPALRKAYLEGDYDAYQGRYFTEFRPEGPLGNEPPSARHVIPQGSIELMPWWPRAIGMDWGYGHWGSAIKNCDHPNGQMILCDELVQRGVGARSWGQMLAQWCIKDLAGLENHTIEVFLSPDAFGQRNDERTIAQQIVDGIRDILGPTAGYLLDEGETNEADLYARLQLQRTSRLVVRRANHARIPGWQKMHELLDFNPPKATAITEKLFDEQYARELHDREGVEAYAQYIKMFAPKAAPSAIPGLLITDNCKKVRRALESAVHDDDPAKKEDVLKVSGSIHDDVLDSIRYLCMGRKHRKGREPFAVVSDRAAEMALRQTPHMTPDDLMAVRRKAYEDWMRNAQKPQPFIIRTTADSYGAWVM